MKGEKQMYLIRSRKIDWHEVSAEKAIDYAKKMIKMLGYAVPRSYQEMYLKRFVKGVELQEVI